MARRIVTDEERARREARAVQMQAIVAECSRTKSAIRSAGLHSQPQYWLNRACREELGAAPHALADELLPAAIRVAKRMTFQVEQFVAALPPRKSKGSYQSKDYQERMAGLKDALRCEVRRTPAPAASESAPGKTLGQYVRERFRQRAEARAGPVPAMQVPERENPASWQARGVQVKQASTLECADVNNGTTPAATPQPPRTTEVVVGSEVLARDGAEDMEFNASCLIGNAIDTLVDVECNKLDFEQIRAAIVGLDCARSLVRRLCALAEKAGGR